jgi:hypothetical protein
MHIQVATQYTTRLRHGSPAGAGFRDIAGIRDSEGFVFDASSIGTRSPGAIEYNIAAGSIATDCFKQVEG